jgi:hypothetical protein
MSPKQTKKKYQDQHSLTSSFPEGLLSRLLASRPRFYASRMRSRARLTLFSNTTSFKAEGANANLSATLPHTTAIRETILPASSPSLASLLRFCATNHSTKLLTKLSRLVRLRLRSALSRDPCAAAACRRTGSTSHSRILSSAHPSTMPGVRKSYPPARSLAAFVALANHSLQQLPMPSASSKTHSRTC